MATSKMISLTPYESINKLESSLREAYDDINNFTKHLTPPLKLTILKTPQEYVQLNKAILYGVLCEPILGKTHIIKYLHAIVNDGYALFCSLLVEIIDGLFVKMLEVAKVNVFWVASVMVDVCGVGFGRVLVSLLRQIVGGDFSEGNLWLCYQMVSLFSSKWDVIFEEEEGEGGEVMSFGLYCFLRLLGDHVRLESNARSNELKRKEIGFCVRMFREKFHLCLRIGRDLIRVLQDLVHVPEFREIWKDLVCTPGCFRVPGFLGISQIYGTRTSSRYIVLRITPEMECQLRFLLTHVKFGSQKRHLMWFVRKFLFVPERETLIVDIVRFICCAHHPPNEVLQSDVIPRWAVIGWLLNSCTKKYVEANVKLALFYDWLFFDDKVDNVMNIEPAMLLMVNSIPKYVDMTHSLIEFLVLLADNYDTERKNVILKGVSSAISMLVRAGVVGSFDVLTSCDLLSSFVKEMLQKLVLKTKSAIVVPPPTASLSLDVEPSTVSESSYVQIHMSRSARQPLVTGNVQLGPTSCCTTREPVDSAASTSSIAIGRERIASCIGKIGENMKISNKTGQEIVKDILLLFMSSHSFDYTSECLAFEVKKELELAGYKLFSPCERLSTSTDEDVEEVDSVTAEIIRIFIFSRHEKIMELLMCWSRSGCLVGVRLLSYALRLAYEAQVAGYGENTTSEIDSNKIMPLLQCHIDRYITFVSAHGNDVHGTNASSSISIADKKLIPKIVEDAFSSYICIVKHHREAFSKELDVPPGKLLSSDVLSCSLWRSKRLRDSIRGIFSYLADISQCDEDVILLILSHLQHEDYLTVHIDVCLKRFSIFGKDVQNVLQLIRRSVYWEEILQHKLWALIVSELSVSDFSIEKLLLDFFYSVDVDPKGSCIVLGGLMMLISCCPPTSELVGAVMLLPDNKCTDFAAAVLSRWVVANESVLSNSVSDFFDKIMRKSENVAVDWGGIVINQSAALFLIRYLEAQGTQAIDLLERLPLNLSDVKTSLKNPAVPMDPG